MTLKGTPDISIYQIAFKVDHKCVLHSNSNPKRYNCIIIYSIYQISDLSRKSYHKWLWFWEVQDSRSKIDKSNHSSKYNFKSMWPWPGRCNGQGRSFKCHQMSWKSRSILHKVLTESGMLRALMIRVSATKT